MTDRPVIYKFWCQSARDKYNEERIMKIKYDEPEKAKRPCTFKDVPIHGVFTYERDFSDVFHKNSETHGEHLVGSIGVTEFLPHDNVTYYPDAELVMGRAVTEVEV